MKTTVYCLIIFLLITSLDLFSQSYKNILANENVWDELYVFEAAVTTKYKTIGDTIFLGKEYKKIGAQSFASGPFVLVFLIREDSLEKKLYFVDNFNLSMDTVEYLLYDFNVNIGDTVSVHMPRSINYSSYMASDTFNLVLDSYTAFDNINNDDTALVFSYVDNIGGYPNVYWIKGLGSRAGIGFSAMRWPPMDGTQIICASKNGDDCFYYEPFGSSHNCNISYSEVSKFTEVSYKLYPNPCKNEITVSGKSINFIQIIDIAGIEIRAINVNSYTKTINLEGLRKGIYFIIINNESVKKIIVY